MERKGLEDLSGALRKFAKERVTGIEGTTGLEAANPVISNAFATFTQQSLDIIRNSTTPNQAINKILPLLSAQRGGVGGIAGLGASQNQAIKPILDNFRDELKVQQRTNTELLAELSIKLSEQTKTQREQLKAQLEELKVTQALRFGGDGAFSPEKFAQDFANAQADIIKGQFTGNRDLQTQGQLNILRSFRDLQITNRAGTLGEIGKPAIDSLAKQIEENLRFAIQGLD